MAITQKMIAAHLGISPQAVNFALGHRADQVSHQTRDRVRQAARELGYRTNSAAKAIAQGRFNAVGLLMSLHSHQSTVFGQMLRGIHEVLDEREMHLAVTFVDDRRLVGDDDLPKILGQSMVDGLLLNYTHHIPARMVELIDRHAIPAVWINSRQHANCVHPDDEGAGYQATRLLLDAGHRKITYTDFLASCEDSGEIHYSHPDRRAGYERAMREAGGEPLAIVSHARMSFEAPVNAAREMLAASNRPTAIVGYSANDAQAFVQAAASLGLRIGADLSLVVIEQMQSLVGPSIDTLLLPEYEVGHAAGTMLLARLDDPDGDQPPVAVPMKYQAGQTVCPVAATIQPIPDQQGAGVLSVA